MSDVFDPPDEEVPDEFDVAIARSVMNNTWGSVGASVGFGALSWCCDPFLVCTLLAFGGAINAWVRLATMDRDLRTLVPVPELIAAAAFALAGLGLPVLRLGVLLASRALN